MVFIQLNTHRRLRLCGYYIFHVYFYLSSIFVFELEYQEVDLACCIYV